MRFLYTFAAATQLALSASAQSLFVTGNVSRTCSASLCGVHSSHDKPSTIVTTFTPPGETVTSTTVITVDTKGNPIKPRPTITSTTVVYVNDVAKTKRHERSLSWTNMPAGYTNATSVVGATAASENAVSGGPIATGASSSSSSAVHPKVLISKTGSGHHTHDKPTVTVTHRETIIETMCPYSTSSIGPMDPNDHSQDTSIHTAAVVEASIDLPSPQSPAHTGNSLLATTVTLPPTQESVPTPQTDAPMSTFTAQITTWHTVIVTFGAVASVSTSGPANENGSAKPYVDQRPEEPIDQAYGMPAQSPSAVEPNTQSAGNTKLSTSCTDHISATDLAGGPPVNAQTISPIVGTGTAPGNAFASSNPHAVLTVPMIPSIPYGHPPALSNSRKYHNTTVPDQTSSTYLQTAASVSMTAPHMHTELPIHSEQHEEQAKCTTTFQHATIKACTATQCLSTTTLAINCHGCVGEQAKPLPVYDENDKCGEPTTTIIPISTMSVCEVSNIVAGAAKPTEAYTAVASSGFVTRASAI